MLSHPSATSLEVRTCGERRNLLARHDGGRGKPSQAGQRTKRCVTTHRGRGAAHQRKRVRGAKVNERQVPSCGAKWPRMEAWGEEGRERRGMRREREGREIWDGKISGFVWDAGRPWRGKEDGHVARHCRSWGRRLSRLPSCRFWRAEGRARQRRSPVKVVRWRPWFLSIAHAHENLLPGRVSFFPGRPTSGSPASLRMWMWLSSFFPQRCCCLSWRRIVENHGSRLLGIEIGAHCAVKKREEC